MKWQSLYYEERRRCADLQSTLANIERRNQELEKQFGIDLMRGVGPSRTLRRSFSNDQLRRGQTHAPSYNPQRPAAYSPPNRVPRAISSNEIIGAAVNKQANNSFD